MSQLEVADNNVAADTERASSAYVPRLQRTEGQPPPIAANDGLSYMSFDREGDAGTAAALEDALTQIAEGEGQRVNDMIDNAPPGPIETRWGLGFRDYDGCIDYIRANGIKAPEGGLALPNGEKPTPQITNAPSRAGITAAISVSDRAEVRDPACRSEPMVCACMHPSVTSSLLTAIGVA